jgi:hypothetical protein
MSEWAFVIASFGLTWMVLAGYAAYLQGRVRRAEGAMRDAILQAEVER